MNHNTNLSPAQVKARVETLAFQSVTRWAMERPARPVRHQSFPMIVKGNRHG
jgi:hypothetical protein